MAAMVTTLNEFSDTGNSRTFSLAAHSVAEPRLVIQKRTVPATVDSVAEDSVKVVYGTSDIAGVALSSKVTFEISFRRPVKGDTADVASALALLREIVASDNYSSVVSSQQWLQN